jgi:pimeloyl-ACP methyl ester carboxylesterase
MTPRTLIGLFTLVALAGCRQRAPTAAQPREATATVNGVRLAWLDWGGRGTGMVFIHGLGDSPHAFDEIAPHFTDRFHVVAYARRGHAHSQDVGPYTHTVLAEDLRQLLDTLHMDKVVLVGWSLGGNELTEYAVAHPEHVAGLVFLECYNLGIPEARGLVGAFPVPSAPSPRDLASQPAFRAWWTSISSPNAPLSAAMEAEVAELTVPAQGGSVRIVTSDSITSALFADALTYDAPYAQLRVPVLAVWGHGYRDGIIARDAPDSLKRRVDAYLRDYSRPFQDSTVARMRRAVPGATIIVLDSGTHAIFPSQRHDTIIGAMKEFVRRLE